MDGGVMTEQELDCWAFLLEQWKERRLADLRKRLDFSYDLVGHITLGEFRESLPERYEYRVHGD
jgi:hypothetical protein